jgi:hypothetical protein
MALAPRITKHVPVTFSMGTSPSDMLYQLMIMQAKHGAFGVDAVIDAAMKVFLEGLHQRAHDRSDAERQIDAIHAKVKGILLDQYDAVTGRKRQQKMPARILMP